MLVAFLFTLIFASKRLLSTEILGIVSNLYQMEFQLDAVRRFCGGLSEEYVMRCVVVKVIWQKTGFRKLGFSPMEKMVRMPYKTQDVFSCLEERIFYLFSVFRYYRIQFALLLIGHGGEFHTYSRRNVFIAPFDLVADNASYQGLIL